MTICTIEDNFLYERIMGEVIWIAILNDNTVVYQDDYRPNISPDSAWLRLKEYCETENKYITCIKLRFRSHWETCPQNKTGYMFVKSALGQLNSDRTIGYYIVGYIENNRLFVEKYRVPELIKELEEERSIEDYQNLIIWKRN